jgi:hypothetical protein
MLGVPITLNCPWPRQFPDDMSSKKIQKLCIGWTQKDVVCAQLMWNSAQMRADLAKIWGAKFAVWRGRKRYLPFGTEFKRRRRFRMKSGRQMTIFVIDSLP